MEKERIQAAMKHGKGTEKHPGSARPTLPATEERWSKEGGTLLLSEGCAE